MRTRWKVNEAAAFLAGFVWLLGGMFAVIAIRFATHRHSTAVLVAVLVWVTPFLVAAFGLLWWLVMSDVFGERPRFGLPVRRVREPVVRDLREM